MKTAWEGDARIVVEQDVALERGFPLEHCADQAGRKPLQARVEVEREPPPRALPRNDDLPLRPHVRARGKVELRREIVHGARAVEGELDRRQARETGEMGEQAASRLGGVYAEREMVSGRNVGQKRLEYARCVEPLRSVGKVEAFGRRSKRGLAGNAEAYWRLLLLPRRCSLLWCGAGAGPNI
jgi:hypothetical protein